MNTTSLPIGRLLLLLAVLLCLFGDSALAQKTKPRTKQSAPAQTPHASIATAASGGVFVFCGMTIASPSRPAADTVGYRVERREPGASWVQIADVSAARDAAGFASIAGAARLRTLATGLRLAGETEAWDRVSEVRAMTRLPFAPTRDDLRALGVLYFDSTVTAGRRYEYRVSTLLASGRIGRTGEPAAVVAGEQWNCPSMRVRSVSVLDTAVTVQWGGVFPAHAPSLFHVTRMTTGDSDRIALPDVRGFRRLKDTVVVAILDTDVVVSQHYTYTVTPEDYFGNTGPESDPAHVFAVDARRLPLPMHTTAESDSFGIRLSWTLTGTRYVHTVRVWRGEKYNGPWTMIAELPSTADGWLDQACRQNLMYFYRFSTVTFGGAESQKTPQIFAAWKGGVPPATPRGLTAKTVRGGVELHWQEVKSDDIAGYFVYRAAATDVPFELISGAVRGTRYVDSSRGLNGVTSYVYAVAAVDANQRKGRMSSSVYCKAGIITSPAPPREVFARVIGGLIRVNWRDAREFDPTVVAYVVYRAESGARASAPVRLRVIHENLDRTFLTDSTAKPGVEYVYAVSVVDMTGHEGVRSAPAAARIPIVLPPPPSELHAVGIEGVVRLEWMPPAAEDGISRINIYRHEAGGAPRRVATVDATVRTWSDDKVKKGTAWYYSLTAVDRAGLESEPSPEVAAVP